MSETIILESPAGFLWELTIDNDGALLTAQIFPSVVLPRPQNFYRNLSFRGAISSFDLNQEMLGTICDLEQLANVGLQPTVVTRDDENFRRLDRIDSMLKLMIRARA